MSNPQMNDLAPSVPHPIAEATDLIDAWLEFERLNGASIRTIETYRESIAVFIVWTEDIDVLGRSMAASDIRAYKDFLSKAYSPATVNIRLSAIRSFYRWMVTTDRLPFNPAKEVKGAKRSNSTQHKRDALTAGEMLRIFAACNAETETGIRDRAMLTLFAYCALRTIEVHRANIEHLQTQGERMILRVWGKGHVEADELVVIPVDQEPYMHDWIRVRMGISPTDYAAPLFVSLSTRGRGNRLSTRAIREIIKTLYRQAGVIGQRKTTHSLRHTAITTAIRRGATPMQVQAMARHKSFDTTLNYYHEVNRLDSPAEDTISYDKKPPQ